MKTIILLGGKINSGKNAAYDIIVKNYDFKNIQRIYFAQPIKEMCEKIFASYSEHVNEIVNKTSEILKKDDNFGYLQQHAISAISQLQIKPENWYEDKTECTRMILQIVGTDIIRNEVADTFWIQKAAEQIKNSSADTFVITDFRFPNELYDLSKFLDEDETTEYKVVTISLDRELDKDNDNIHSHESENAFKDFNEWFYIINNNKDLAHLEASVLATFDDIFSGDD